MRHILIILMVIFLSSCITEKKCNSKFPPQIIRKDSISYVEKEKIKYRDTTIYVKLPNDTITKWDTLKIQNGIASVKPVIVEGVYSIATAWIAYNKLMLKLIEGKGDSIKVELNNVITERDRWKEKYVKESTKETRTIKENTKFAGFTIAFFWSIIALILLGGVFAYLFVRFKKIIP